MSTVSTVALESVYEPFYSPAHGAAILFTHRCITVGGVKYHVYKPSDVRTDWTDPLHLVSDDSGVNGVNSLLKDRMYNDCPVIALGSGTLFKSIQENRWLFGRFTEPYYNSTATKSGYYANQDGLSRFPSFSSTVTMVDTLDPSDTITLSAVGKELVRSWPSGLSERTFLGTSPEYCGVYTHVSGSSGDTIVLGNAVFGYSSSDITEAAGGASPFDFTSLCIAATPGSEQLLGVSKGSGSNVESLQFADVNNTVISLSDRLQLKLDSSDPDMCLPVEKSDIEAGSGRDGGIKKIVFNLKENRLVLDISYGGTYSPFPSSRFYASYVDSTDYDIFTQDGSGYRFVPVNSWGWLPYKYELQDGNGTRVAVSNSSILDGPATFYKWVVEPGGQSGTVDPDNWFTTVAVVPESGVWGLVLIDRGTVTFSLAGLTDWNPGLGVVHAALGPVWRSGGSNYDSVHNVHMWP